MTFETKLKNTKLKNDLLKKSNSQRQRHADEVRLQNVAARPGRNDLLPELAIVMRPVESLKNANRRTRKPTADQLERVTASLKAFGIVTPLLIDTDDRLIAGHIVRDAAHQLGLREVPCVIIDHLGADELRLLGVALNRIAETGSWDLDLLKLELGDLELACLDLGVTGFSLPELDIVLGENAEDRADEVEPQPDEDTPVVSRLGDIWHLGPHRIVCGDALDGDSYERLLEGRLAQGVFSDPPYNCPIEGFVSGLGKTQHKDFAMAVGEMSDEAFHDFLKTYLVHCKRHLSVGAVIFACMDWRQIDVLLGAGKAAGLARINLAVWCKGSGGMGGLYRSAYELIAVFCNGKAPATNNVELGRHGRDRTNAWTYAGANRRGSSASTMLGNHPTPKPVELVADALLDVTRRGDIVLDPFMGSGTTIIAAEKTGRIAVGIELDPKYVDLAVRRWQDATGLVAELAETRQSFGDVAKARLLETECASEARAGEDQCAP
ncbi:DNA modification methylase [Aquisediminimonas profunda]|uniref:DNA modification methylase n=1 Tax=Aquisediminimonas profunda TaxID=1550733 RepID=UPI001C629F37|nr:DNA modification methylase [Aquisediminimonas profunda]